MARMIEAGLKTEMANAASTIPSLDIRDLLKRIEGKSKGPKRVTIDPSELTKFGANTREVPEDITVQ
jgi:hypothetical protein